MNTDEMIGDDAKRMSILRQVANRNGCKLTSRWNTIVHKR